MGRYLGPRGTYSRGGDVNAATRKTYTKRPICARASLRALLGVVLAVYAAIYLQG
jgi:hypothetical protein